MLSSFSSDAVEVDGLFGPRCEGRGGLNPIPGGRGGGTPPLGGGGGRGPFFIEEGTGGGPGPGGRGPPEGFSSGGGGGGGGDGADGGGVEAGFPFPEPIVGSELLALPGGGFNGGSPAMPDVTGAEFSADVIPAPATVPIGIPTFESPPIFL